MYYPIKILDTTFSKKKNGRKVHVKSSRHVNKTPLHSNDSHEGYIIVEFKYQYQFHDFD
jgi:hypothetical protein